MTFWHRFPKWPRGFSRCASGFLNTPLMDMLSPEISQGCIAESPLFREKRPWFRTPPFLECRNNVERGNLTYCRSSSWCIVYIILLFVVLFWPKLIKLHALKLMQQQNPICESAKFWWHIFGLQEVLPHLYEVYHRRFRGWRRSWFSLVSSSSWSQVYQVWSEPRLGWWSRKLVCTWELNFGTFGKVTHQSVQDWKWWAAFWRLPQCTRGCIEKSCETG